jgi:uncharacterized protein (DUF1810 family)
MTSSTESGNDPHDWGDSCAHRPMITNLEHPLLGPRLVECAEASLGIEGRSAFDVFNSPDDMKLKSGASVSPTDSVFARLLDKFFKGERDANTLQLLGTGSRSDG